MNQSVSMVPAAPLVRVLEKTLVRISLVPSLSAPRIFIATVSDKNLRGGKAGYEARFESQLELTFSFYTSNTS